MALRNNIKDAGVALVVDPFTRRVTVPATERVIGVVGDHCSEQVTFQIPRYIDNHDMLHSTRRYVAWRNVDGEPGTDELKVTESTDDHILFGWTIRDRLTLAKGLVEFSLHFECWAKDEEGNEKMVYKWGTRTCPECEILDAVNAVLGAYEAIYIDGETLVFSDYAPVFDETVAIKSGIIPEGTLELNEAGKQDVGRYAYVEVKGVYEKPTITVPLEPDGSKGYIRAEANGQTAEMMISPPSLTVDGDTVTATSLGLVTTRKIQGRLPLTHTPVTIGVETDVEGIVTLKYLYYSATDAAVKFAEKELTAGETFDFEAVPGSYVRLRSEHHGFTFYLDGGTFAPFEHFAKYTNLYKYEAVASIPTELPDGLERQTFRIGKPVGEQGGGGSN